MLGMFGKLALTALGQQLGSGGQNKKQPQPQPQDEFLPYEEVGGDGYDSLLPPPGALSLQSVGNVTPPEGMYGPTADSFGPVPPPPSYAPNSQPSVPQRPAGFSDLLVNTGEKPPQTQGQTEQYDPSNFGMFTNLFKGTLEQPNGLLRLANGYNQGGLVGALGALGTDYSAEANPVSTQSRINRERRLDLESRRQNNIY